MPALFHFHVPKTAGHSIINEVREHFLPSQVLTERGNLTLPFLQTYGEQRLRDFGFIYGHAGHGAVSYLQGITDTILLLREPMDHMISHYLHMVRDPTVQWHQLAKELGFRDFILTYPGILAFQAISLATGLGQVVPPERPYDCLPDLVRFLESTFLLGTVDQIDEFMASLARIKQWPAPALMRRLNKAPVSQKLVRAELEDAYAAVARSTHYGAILIAVEHAVYAAAKHVAAVQREQRSLRSLGETARRVWQSASGEIVLGHNFGRREMVDGEPAWWTLEGSESQIHLTAGTHGTLHADIRVWHAVDPSCVQVWIDECKLDARIVQTADGYGSLTVPLANVACDRTATVTLRVDPRHAPTDAPWYPTLLLHHFHLA